MNIAYFTSMYPTVNAPNGGVFITKRIEALLNKNINLDLYAVIYFDSKLVSKIRKILNKNYVNNQVEPIIKSPNSDIIFTPIIVKSGIIAFLLNKLTGYRYQAWSTYITIKRKLGKIDHDIIHCHWLYPTGTGVLKYSKYCGIPFVVTSHGSDTNVLLRKTSMKKKILETLEQASKVEFVSNALREKAIIYGYSNKNSIVVPNGIDRQDSNNNYVYHHLKKNIVGYVGNLVEIKRSDELPSIINKIHEELEGKVEFYIVGDGPLRDMIEKKIKHSNVKFFGRVEHKRVLELMSEMKVLMLPSRNEGWPCVVLEAFSVGTPVIGSNNGGVPEAIGDKRFIVNEDNFTEVFSNRVIELLKAEIEFNQKELVDRANDYNWSSLADLTINAYRDILKERDELI